MSSYNKFKSITNRSADKSGGIESAVPKTPRQAIFLLSGLTALEIASAAWVVMSVNYLVEGLHRDSLLETSVFSTSFLFGAASAAGVGLAAREIFKRNEAKQTTVEAVRGGVQRVCEWAQSAAGLAKRLGLSKRPVVEIDAPVADLTPTGNK